jgi:hypothetical protein
MLKYEYDRNDLQIQETQNGDDIEFTIQVFNEQEVISKLKAVRDHFEDNDIYTDVLFYSYANQRYSAIVRPEFYTDFVLQLMKFRIFNRVEWVG